MNFKNYIYIAKNDLKSKPKFCFQMIKGIFFIMIILLISTTITLAVDSYYNNIINGNAADNNITTLMFELDENNHIKEDSKNVLNKVSEITGVSTVSVLFEVFLPDKNGELSLRQEAFENITLTIGNKEYKENKNIPAKQNPMSKDIGLLAQICPENTDVLSESAFKQFQYIYPNQSLIKFGTQPIKNNEVIISEYFLNKFGVEDIKNVIGKNISVNVNGQSFVKNYKISGVINSNLYDIEYFSFDPQLYIMKSEKEFASYNLDKNGTFIACIGNPNNSIDVYKSLQEKDLLKSVFYSESGAKVYAFAGKIRTAVNNIMICIIVFVLIGLIMSIYSIVSANINDSCSYYGMLQAMGMKKASILWIFVLEHLFFIISSILISIIASGFLFIFINYGLHFIMSEGLEISIIAFISSTIIVSLIAGGFILLMEIIIFITNQRKSITENLKKFKVY